MSAPTPPPRGGFDEQGWALLYSWLFPVWKWVSSTLPAMITSTATSIASQLANPFGSSSNTINTYANAVAFTSGMADEGVGPVTIPSPTVDKAYIYRNAAFSTSGGAIPFDTVLFDTGSIVQIGSSSIVPKKLGYYQVIGRCSLITATVNQRLFCFIVKNGSEIIRGADITDPTSSSVMGSVASGIVFCNGTTDSITLSIYDTLIVTPIETGPAVSFLSVMGPF